MKRLIMVVILFAATVFAQAGDNTKPAKPAPAPQRMTIPKDAVKNENGTYSYTDKQGKNWLYRDSPFGVMRTAALEPGADARPNPKQPTAAIKVIDKGDTVQFERATPFGPTRWEKKKSDLTDDERKMFDTQYPSKSETQTETQAQDQDQSGKPDAK
jgi:hypothetical protein